MHICPLTNDLVLERQIELTKQGQFFQHVCIYLVGDNVPAYDTYKEILNLHRWSRGKSLRQESRDMNN